MIVHATRTRRVPAFYVRHVMRRVQLLVAGNPGFHRLVIHIENAAAPVEAAYLVNPDIEPQVRRLLRRVLVLTPPVLDEEPWPQL